MKKLVALLLGSALVASSIVGLAACGPKEQDNPPPPAPPVPEITRRADPRAADAYEAYDYMNEKVGSYKTIADAINATIEADLDFVEDAEVKAGTKGGYVLKKGETKHIFDHTKGFAEGNSDCLWYYEDGNKLEAFDCWNATEMMSLLWNNKVVNYGTVSMGSKAAQQHNGFGLLDGRGELISEETDGAVPKTYMFSKPMDAGVMAFPGEKVGASGLRYTLDLSKAKITPAYEGVEDKIYAYFGFYIWQPYYVIATGLACDTTTGQWYPFRGTSRNDSFYDIVYNVDNSTTPVFTSSWNEEGYFVPDVKTVDLEIKTVRGDELPDDGYRVYFEDHLDIVVNKGLEGEKTEKMIIDDDLVQSLASYNVGADNTFVFIAGLDIKNHDEDVSIVPNVDFFNGAKFEDLTVTKASVYFPTEEELAGGTNLNDPLEEEFRGKWYDALMANDDFTEGTWDFTFLYNYTCTSYEKKDGADVYNFRFDGSPVADSLLGGKLKEYQDTIDGLKNMTVQNFNDYSADYDEVTKWYGLDETHENSTLLQQYYLVLDFTTYTEYAKGVYADYYSLSADAQPVFDELEAMSVLTVYDYKGWTAPEGAESNVGYLWSEAQQFGALLAEFNKLSETDQANILRRYKGGEEEFLNWQDAYEGIKAYLDNTTFTSKSYTLGNIEMDAKKGMVTYTGAQALEKIFELAIKIHATAYKGVPEGEEGTLDSDDTGCFQDGFHLLFLLKKMEEAEVTIPDIFTDIFYAQITSTDRSKAFESDFNDFLYPVLTLAGDIYARQQNDEFVWLDADMAKIINDHMIGFKFSEAGFIWNSTNNADLRDGNTFYEMYFGLPDATTKNAAGDVIGYLVGNLQYIFDVVSMCDDNAKLADTGYSYEAKVTPLTEDPSKKGSADAQAVVAAIGALTDLAAYDYKGWTAPQDAESTVGYLNTELTAFRALVAKREALSAADKAFVKLNIEETVAKYDAWLKLSTEIAAMEATEAWKGNFETLKVDDSTQKQTFKGEAALEEIFKTLTYITAGQAYPGTGDSGANDLTDENEFFTGLWLSGFVHYFEDAGVTLPTIVTEKLKAVKYPTFDSEVRYPLIGNVQLAQRIKDGKYSKAEDLTEADLEFLNKVWVNNYELSATFAWNWNNEQGKKFQTYWGGRTNRVIAIAGGTLKNGTTPLVMHEYIEIIADFLESCNYTVKSNGWGVTADKIVDKTLSAAVLEFIDAFGKLGDINNYKYLGWDAPEGKGNAGYLNSDAKFFTSDVLPKYTALNETEKEVALGLAGAYTIWETLAKEVTALNANETFMNGKFSAPNMVWDTAGEISMQDALGQMINGARLIKSATKWGAEDWENEDANNAGASTMNSDNHWMPSFRIVYFMLRFEDSKITLPQFVQDLLADITDENTQSLIQDIRYIDTVLTIAKKLEDDPDLALDAEIVAMVNATMVGKVRFAEGGLNWNYDPSSGSMGGRKGSFSLFYGLSADHNFGYYLNEVLTFLKTKGNATLLGYDGQKGKIPDKPMGIEAAITLPTA